MTRTLSTAADVTELKERVSKLAHDSSAAWGKMNAHEAVCHTRDGLLLPLGEKSVSPLPPMMGPLSLPPGSLPAGGTDRGACGLRGWRPVGRPAAGPDSLVPFSVVDRASWWA